MNKKILALALAALMSVSMVSVSFADGTAGTVGAPVATDSAAEVVVTDFNGLKSAIGEGKKTIRVDVTSSLSITESLNCNGAELILGKEIDNGSFLLISDGCTLSNAVVNTNGKAKHGVQFYRVNNSGLSGVTVKGGSYTSVIVNGATNVSLEDCKLYPENGAYTNIEWALGKNVTEKPSLSVSNVSFGNSSIPSVYADYDTLTRMGLSENSSTAEIVTALNEKVTGAEIAIIRNDADSEADVEYIVAENGACKFEGTKAEYIEYLEEKNNRDDGESRSSGGDYFGNEKWAKVKREIAAAEEGDTIEMSATGLPWFPSSAARALKGKDVTLEVRKNGVTYSINGLKIGSIDKIWYEFDQIETELLTAEAE